MIQLINVAFSLAAGLFMTRLLKKINLPDVTSYLIAGLLIGPCVLGLLKIEGIGFTSFEEVDKLGIICDVALGFIAFDIGNEFRLSQLKKIGKQAFIVGVLQAVITSALVDVALIILHFIFPNVISIPVAITLGAIAAATAPAATLMVVRQYKAKGNVTDILLPVVALDDAVGLVIFSFSFGIAKAMTAGTLDVLELIVEPVIEICLSLVLGAVCGFLLTKTETLFHSNRNRITMVVTFVTVAVAISKAVFHFADFKCGFSALLVAMMMGTVFCNMSPLSQEIMDRSDKWAAPIMTLFFVVSGAELNLGILKNGYVLLIGVIYLIFRSAGKYIGANFSARISGCEQNVVKYLGITLLPQAGVALGMSSLAIQGLGNSDGTLIRNITLFGVLVYELIGPSLTKAALTKSGDISPKGDDVINRRAKALENAPEKKSYIIGHKKKEKDGSGK